MRYLEIVLKFGFLIGAVYLIISAGISAPAVFCGFLAVSALLGLVLLFNKDASYNFKQSKKDLMMRKIEGSLLIIFAGVMALLTLY